MLQHKFSVGQDVEYLRSAHDSHVPRGRYTITRTLPGDGLIRSYRALSAADGRERVFSEDQLRAGSTSVLG